MELIKGFEGGLNTDDAVEILPPEDYTYALNLVVGRTGVNKNGLVELIRGTRTLNTNRSININNSGFINNLDGWINKATVSLAGDAALSIGMNSPSLILGEIVNISGDAALSISSTGDLTALTGFDVNIQAQYYSAGPVSFKFFYRIDGGSWTLLSTTAISGSGYTSASTINDVNNGSFVEIGVLTTSDASIGFGASLSSSGTFTGFDGQGDPFGDSVTGNTTFYVRVQDPDFPI
jgi:hypothetical protein